MIAQRASYELWDASHRYNDYRMSKRQKAFSRLIFQPPQKAENCFLLLYHCNRNRQISFRNLLANQRFAVEILEFRLSIVVIMNAVCRKGKKPFRGWFISHPTKRFALLGLHSLKQKSTVFFKKTVGKSKICRRNSRISTFDCRYDSEARSEGSRAAP